MLEHPRPSTQSPSNATGAPEAPEALELATRSCRSFPCAWAGEAGMPSVASPPPSTSGRPPIQLEPPAHRSTMRIAHAGRGEEQIRSANPTLELQDEDPRTPGR